MIDSEPIPDDVIHDLLMNAIHVHDLLSLTGKSPLHRNAEDIVQKRACVEYNHKRAEMSILSDCVGVVPGFADKQFERTLRIKQYMVDTIINNLACYNTYWRKWPEGQAKKPLVCI